MADDKPEHLPNADVIKAVGFNPDEGSVSRANARCLVCEQITKAKEVRHLAREGEMGERMVAVVLQSSEGKRQKVSFGDAYACQNSPA